MEQKRELTQAEKDAVVAMFDGAGMAPILRLVGGLIRNAVPNTLESWVDESNAWADEAASGLYSLAHDCNIPDRRKPRKK